jgi:glycosyltransferase involved in cell wall biosynthesis
VLLIYIGWIYRDHPMITFAPTLLHRILPGVHVVTLFENAMGTRMEECSKVMRAIRKGVKTWIGGDGIDYEFGTLLRDSDRLIVMSVAHLARLRDLAATADEKAVLIAPPPLLNLAPEADGISRRRGREMLGVRADEFLIAYLGYVYPAKGIDVLLRAFRMVSDRHPTARLAMIGGVIARRDRERPFYADEMRELSRSLGLADKVIWAGEYPYGSRDPSLYLHGSDAFVFPGIFGIQLNNSSVAAAAVHGLPIITTRGPALEPPFVDGKNVVACPPEDSGSMAHAIMQVIEDGDLRRRLRAGALEVATEWYSWDRAVERTIEALSPSWPPSLPGARASGQVRILSTGKARLARSVETQE